MTNYYDNLIEVAEMMMGILVGACPKDTLALVKTISYKVLDNNNIIITVGDESEGIDYAYYTNVKWTPPIDLQYFPGLDKNGKRRKRSANNRSTLKSHLTGGNNPNEGWFDTALLQGMTKLAQEENGVVLSEL